MLKLTSSLSGLSLFVGWNKEETEEYELQDLTHKVEEDIQVNLSCCIPHPDPKLKDMVVLLPSQTSCVCLDGCSVYYRNSEGWSCIKLMDEELGHFKIETYFEKYCKKIKDTDKWLYVHA